MCSSFNGFSESDIAHVPADIWIVISRENSATMEIYDEEAFDILQSLVSDKYGPPQNLFDHGKIYRGDMPLSHSTTNVTITFFKSTSRVRIQSPGYALWLSKELPKLAEKVMESLQRRTMHTSTPCIQNKSMLRAQEQIDMDISSLPSAPTNQIDNMYNLLQKTLKASEEKAKLEMENQMLREQLHQLTCERAKLQEIVTDKEVKIQMLCARVKEIELIEFEAECDKKLLQATEARFAEERQHLLQQIQDLQSHASPKSYGDSSTSAARSRTYSEVVASSPWTPAPKGQKPTAPASTPIRTQNRFACLEDKAETNLNADSATSRERMNNGSRKSKNKTRTHVVILGDSISKRIDGQRLSRSAQVKNLSVGGRRVEQVCSDVVKHKDIIAEADSLIFHVGTNNLERDSVEEVKSKYSKLAEVVKAHAQRGCEVAVSSVIKRKDNPALSSKVDHVNKVLSDICDNNKWTFINNDAIRDLSRDNLHPNDRGLSFLARNFQDFLRCAHPHLFRQRFGLIHQPQVKSHFPPWLQHLQMGHF